MPKTTNRTTNKPVPPVAELLALRTALFGVQRAALNVSQHNVDADTRRAIHDTRAALSFALGDVKYNELPDAVRLQAHE